MSIEVLQNLNKTVGIKTANKNMRKNYYSKHKTFQTALEYFK